MTTHSFTFVRLPGGRIDTGRGANAAMPANAFTSSPRHAGISIIRISKGR